MQRQPRGRVLPVPSAEEPAEHQGAGELQAALLQVTPADKCRSVELWTHQVIIICSPAMFLIKVYVLSVSGPSLMWC